MGDFMSMRNLGRNLLYAGAMALLITSFQNCGSEFSPGSTDNGSAGGGGLTPAQFAALQTQAIGIINMRCLSCHNGSGTSNAPDLSSISEMLAVGAVVKGQPQNSAVYTSMVDGSMPDGGPMVPSAEYSKIRDWIIFMP